VQLAKKKIRAGYYLISSKTKTSAVSRIGGAGTSANGGAKTKKSNTTFSY